MTIMIVELKITIKYDNITVTITTTMIFILPIIIKWRPEYEKSKLEGKFYNFQKIYCTTHTSNLKIIIITEFSKLEKSKKILKKNRRKNLILALNCIFHA